MAKDAYEFHLDADGLRAIQGRLDGWADAVAAQGKREVEQRAPGSIAHNVSIEREQGKKGETIRDVVIASNPKENPKTQGPKYHPVFSNWGTATQPAQHWGREALKAMRNYADRLTQGLLNR